MYKCGWYGEKPLPDQQGSYSVEIYLPVPVLFGPKKVEISGPTLSKGPRNGFPASKSIRPAPYKKSDTLVILWTRDFRAHSEMV
jgi:hypothetical protein